MPRRAAMLGMAMLFALALSGSSSAGSSSGQIAAGGYHTCALTGAGGVQCWGDNFYGELGDGTQIDRLSPVSVVGLAGGVRAVSAGGARSCALLTTGAVECWGANGVGLPDLTPVAVPGLSAGVQSIAVGERHSCALLTGGGVKCWGDNDAGQLGDGTTTNRATPVDVTGLSSGVEAIAAGSAYSCAILSSSGVKCWGANRDGQLGDGTQTNRLKPVPVANLSTVQTIAADSDHTCALLDGGAVKCWGDNLAGALGDGTEDDHYTPVPVSGLASGVQAIAAGGVDLGFTCAILSGGSVKCWGYNEEGELGDGTGVEDRSKPVAVVGLPSGAQAIAAGGQHACALLAGGTVKCWGHNTSGQLGNGTRTRELTLRVVGGGRVSAPGVRHCHQAFGEPLECILERPQGTTIALTARAAKRWVFKGWSGACKGRARRCALVLKADTKATARFVRRKRRR